MDRFIQRVARAKRVHQPQFDENGDELYDFGTQLGEADAATATAPVAAERARPPLPQSRGPPRRPALPLTNAASVPTSGSAGGSSSSSSSGSSRSNAPNVTHYVFLGADAANEDAAAPAANQHITLRGQQQPPPLAASASSSIRSRSPTPVLSSAPVLTMALAAASTSSSSSSEVRPEKRPKPIADEPAAAVNGRPQTPLLPISQDEDDDSLFSHAPHPCSAVYGLPIFAHQTLRGRPPAFRGRTSSSSHSSSCSSSASASTSARSSNRPARAYHPPPAPNHAHTALQSTRAWSRSMRALPWLFPHVDAPSLNSADRNRPHATSASASSFIPYVSSLEFDAVGSLLLVGVAGNSDGSGDGDGDGGEPRDNGCGQIHVHDLDVCAARWAGTRGKHWIGRRRPSNNTSDGRDEDGDGGSANADEYDSAAEDDRESDALADWVCAADNVFDDNASRSDDVTTHVGIGVDDTGNCQNAARIQRIEARRRRFRSVAAFLRRLWHAHSSSSFTSAASSSLSLSEDPFGADAEQREWRAQWEADHPRPPRVSSFSNFKLSSSSSSPHSRSNGVAMPPPVVSFGVGARVRHAHFLPHNQDAIAACFDNLNEVHLFDLRRARPATPTQRLVTPNSASRAHGIIALLHSPTAPHLLWAGTRRSEVYAWDCRVGRPPVAQMISASRTVGIGQGGARGASGQLYDGPLSGSSSSSSSSSSLSSSASLSSTVRSLQCSRDGQLLFAVREDGWLHTYDVRRSAQPLGAFNMWATLGAELERCCAPVSNAASTSAAAFSSAFPSVFHAPSLSTSASASPTADAALFDGFGYGDGGGQQQAGARVRRMTVPPELTPLTNFTAPPSLFPAAGARTLGAVLAGGIAGTSRLSSSGGSGQQGKRVALRPVSRRLVASATLDPCSERYLFVALECGSVACLDLHARRVDTMLQSLPSALPSASAASSAALPFADSSPSPLPPFALPRVRVLPTDAWSPRPSLAHIVHHSASAGEHGSVVSAVFCVADAGRYGGRVEGDDDGDGDDDEKDEDDDLQSPTSNTFRTGRRRHTGLRPSSSSSIPSQSSFSSSVSSLSASSSSSAFAPSSGALVVARGLTGVGAALRHRAHVRVPPPPLVHAARTAANARAAMLVSAMAVHPRAPMAVCGGANGALTVLAAE